MKTREFIGGRWVVVDDQFRQYSDPSRSSQDYLAFLKNNPRYKNVLASPDLPSAILAMEKSGYATDPAYGAKLANLTARTDTQQAFLNARRNELMQAGAAPHLAELGARQSALETGWGKSAPGSNFYGIKSHGKPAGEVGPRQVDLRTASSDPDLPPQMQMPGDPRTGAAMDPNELAAMGLNRSQIQQWMDANGYGGQQGGMMQPQPQRQQSWLERGMSHPLFTMGAGILAAPGNYGDWAGAIGHGALLAQEAMQQTQKLNAEMDQRSRGGLPQNIQEIMMLRQMYPDLTDEEITSMAFAGRVPTGGEKYENVGGQIYQTNYDSMGRPYMAPIGEEEQAGREGVLRSEEAAKTIGQKYGEVQVQTIKDTSQSYRDVSQQLSKTNQLLTEFESGKFKGKVGALTGRIQQFFDPATAELQAQEMESALQNLGIENLAPVSNYEVNLIRRMAAGAFLNEDQNIAVLRKLKTIQNAKRDALKRTLNRLKTESIEDYLLDPETVEFNDFEDPDLAETPGGPQGPVSPAPGAPPGPTPGPGGGYDPEAARRALMNDLYAPSPGYPSGAGGGQRMGDSDQSWPAKAMDWIGDRFKFNF